MIVGITGTQGQGKSTTISELEKSSDRFVGANIQSARNLLKHWGYTLEEVNKYPPLKVKFQEELYFRHYDDICRENYTHGSDSTLLVERTFVDIFVYAIVTLGALNEYSNWLDEYYEKCMDAQAQLFDNVFFLCGRTYTPVDDGVRSVNAHYSNLVDYLMGYYAIKMQAKDGRGTRYVDTPDLTERVEVITKCIHPE